MSADADGMVLTAAFIDLMFVVYAADMLADVWSGSVVNIDLSRVNFVISVSIGAVAGILADVLAGVITRVLTDSDVDVLTNALLTAVMTVLEFISSVSFC